MIGQVEEDLLQKGVLAGFGAFIHDYVLALEEKVGKYRRLGFPSYEMPSGNGFIVNKGRIHLSKTKMFHKYGKNFQISKYL